MLGCQPPAFGVSLCGRQRGEIHDIEPESVLPLRRLIDYLSALPVDQREPGAEVFVPAHHIIEALRQRRHIEPAIDAQCTRHVVGRADQADLIEKPQRLLRIRERQRRVPRPTSQGRNDEALSPLAGFLDSWRERPDGRRLEQCPQRQLDREGVRDPRDQLRGDQRMSAAIEEVVVDARRRALQHVAPDCR